MRLTCSTLYIVLLVMSLTPCFTLGSDDADSDFDRLTQAILNNSSSELQQLLDAGANPRASSGSNTVLHIAATNGTRSICEVLLGKMSKEEQIFALAEKNWAEMTPLAAALSWMGCNRSETVILDIVHLFLDMGADPVAFEINQLTCLHNAASNTTRAVCEVLWNRMSSEQQGSVLEAKWVEGDTPLLCACQNDFNKSDQAALGVIDFFLEKGANLLAINLSGYTVLHKASKFGTRMICEKIWNAIPTEVQAVALEAHDYVGNTPLFLAVQNARGDNGEPALGVVDFLLSKGANLFAKTAKINLLHTASFFGTRSICEKIWNAIPVESQMSLLEAHDAVDNTPLFHAVQNVRSFSDGAALGVIDFLLEEGADPMAKNMNGDTVLHMAAKFGTRAICEKIWDAIPIEKQASALEMLAVNGATPLLAAFDNDRENSPEAAIDVVGLLLEKGASLRAKLNNGWTVLGYSLRLVRYATSDMRKEICKIALASGQRAVAIDELCYGAQYLDVEWVDKLLSDVPDGFDIQAVDRHGNTPVMCAHLNRNPQQEKQIISLLLSRGARLESLK